MRAVVPAFRGLVNKASRKHHGARAEGHRERGIDVFELQHIKRTIQLVYVEAAMQWDDRADDLTGHLLLMNAGALRAWHPCFIQEKNWYFTFHAHCDIKKLVRVQKWAP